MLGGVTATAGGLVLTGDNDGNLLVFNSDTGDLVFKYETGGAIGGGVVTYERDGRQYVALASGNLSYASAGLVGHPSIIILALPESVTNAAMGDAPDPVRGRLLYSQTCAVCHGPDGDKVSGKTLWPSG